VILCLLHAVLERCMTRNWMRLWPTYTRRLKLLGVFGRPLARALPSRSFQHMPFLYRSSLPFVEPHVLLAQIYWSHQYGNDGQHIEKAKAHLRKLVEYNSARRELWTNLGLLMYSSERHGDGLTGCLSFVFPFRAVVLPSDPVALNQSEYLILAAAVGHALAPNDMFLGYLWNNAGYSVIASLTVTFLRCCFFH
jgi:hypothetical protein